MACPLTQHPAAAQNADRKFIHIGIVLVPRSCVRPQRVFYTKYASLFFILRQIVHLAVKNRQRLDCVRCVLSLVLSNPLAPCLCRLRIQRFIMLKISARLHRKLRQLAAHFCLNCG